MRTTKYLLQGIAFIALSAPFAARAQVQMLPPIQSGTVNTVCPSLGTNNFLTWDGASALKCQAGVVVDNAGNVGIGTTTSAAKLDVAGGVKIAMDAANCTTTKAGTIRFNGSVMQYCDGSTWSSLVGLGSEWISPTFYEDTEGTFVGAECPAGKVMTGLWTQNYGMGGHNNWYIVCR